MAKITRCTRLDPWLANWLDGLCARRGGIDVSDGLRRLVLERWAVEQYPELEYRKRLDGLRLGVRAGPDVWEVVERWRAGGEDDELLRRHFGGLLEADALKAALAVHRRAAGLVEEELAHNRRAAAVVKQLAGTPAPRSSLLLDWCVPEGALEVLRVQGLDASHVGELAPPPEGPEALLERAREQGRALVTSKCRAVGTLVRGLIGQPLSHPPVVFAAPEREPADAERLGSEVAEWAGRTAPGDSEGWQVGWLG